MPVVGRLDQFGSMMVTGEFNEINYIVSAGQSSFITPGTFSWTVPTGVDTISVVTVGGGGGGGGDNNVNGKGGGGGGALAYVNSISVTPGETLTVGVGTSGQPGIVPTSTASNGGNSYVKRGAISLVEAGGGQKGNSPNVDGNSNGGTGGTVIVGTGGNGGAGGTATAASGGGGGAGGYSGNGGAGGSAGAGANGSGGGGGGGGRHSSASTGGGGVGILGQGASGNGGSSNNPGTGGSGGQNGSTTTGAGSILVGGGNFGGGGGGGGDLGRYGSVGGVGAVRIIWGLGANRQFPATNVGDLTETYAKAGISGLGTYTALQFSENIGTATTIRANVFAPYDPVYDEFGGVLFGPGQGTFMRQELNGNVIVYNEINEIGLDSSYNVTAQSTSIDEGGTVTFSINATNVPDGTELYYEIASPQPSIITSGLVMNLDAGNTSSYPGSGTTWTDLSGNNNTGTLTNGPTYSSDNNGSIVFDGTDDKVDCGNSATLQITQGTISAWIRADNGNAGFNGIITKQLAWSLFVKDNILISYDWGNTAERTTGITVGNGTWNHVAMTFTETVGTPSNNAIIYVNGSPVLTTTVKHSAQTAPVQIGDGNNTSQNFGGNVSQTLIYNRALSASEVAQNYNALRGRYGL